MTVPCLLSLPVRKFDEHGCGHYGANRGSRTHEGVDIICPRWKEVSCGIYGEVTKLGYTYADDPSFRYVQITAAINRKHYHFRFFYVSPVLKVGERVDPDSVIGTIQSLQDRYPGITDHCHFEIHDVNENPVDPTPVLIAMRQRM